MPDHSGIPIVWARSAALAFAGVGAVLLRVSFGAIAARGGEMSAITLTIPVIWFAGGVAVMALAPATMPERLPPAALRPALQLLRERLQGHPVLAACAIGAAFAAICLAGALLLLRVPLTSAWVQSAVHTANTNAGAVFVVALVTGAAEEVYFRIGLRAVLPSRWYPIGSTAIYGIVTAATANGALVMASILLGLVAALAYQWVARWYVPIIIHALWTVSLIGIFPSMHDWPAARPLAAPTVAGLSCGAFAGVPAVAG